MQSHVSFFRALLFLFAFSSGLLLSGKGFADSNTSRFPLRSTGVDADASGRASATLNETKSVFTVTVYKLASTTPYEVQVDGITQGTFTTDRKGYASVQFRAPKYGRYRLFDFEPRGKMISVLDSSGTVMLEGMFSAPDEFPGSTVTESASLTNQTLGSRAKASASYVRTSTGVETFSVSVSGHPAGAVSVVVNGQPAGDINVVKGLGALRLRRGTATIPSGYQALTFDPRVATVDILSGDVILFTGVMQARAFGANVDKRLKLLLPVTAVTEPPAGTAKAKWEVTEKARRKFSVEIEDAAEGAYVLSVGGVQRTVIQVVSVPGGGTEGSVEFSNGDDDGDELPLVFDVLGALISISQGGTVLFESTFDPATLSGIPTSEPQSRLEEDLASTGVDADASAEARYEVDDKGRHRFKLEVEDVAVGSYVARIGGVNRATIRAVDVGGAVEGEVEFRSVVERGKVLLNFDPRGQLIEIVDSTGVVLFSHLLGSGSAPGAGSGGGGGSPLPELWRVSLLAEAGVSGVASIAFERKFNGETKLKVEAKNLAAGSYDVSIGGMIRGTLNVTVSGGETEGELEFETEPDDSSELLLNFEVAGQPAVISLGGTVLFSRVLP